MKTDSPYATKNIAVLMGGPGSEREVSLQTGAGVLDALLSLGYKAFALDWKEGESLPARLAETETEAVWNALHGTYGEDGAVQGLLTCLQIPCTGSGILSSAMAMDKIASKALFESQKIPTPPWLTWHPELDIEALPFPCVVKPANEGSSVGVSLVHSPEEFADALALAEKCHGPTLIEEYIAGKEVFVGILDDDAIGTIEVRTARAFYDYEAKYLSGDTQYIIPAEIDSKLSDELEALALKAHRVLGCTGYSRVDIRVAEDRKAYVLEVNTLPGMTGSSLMPKLAKHQGISYPQLCEQILLMAK